MKTSLLGRFRLRSKAAQALLPASELRAETAEGFGMVIRDPFYEWNRHQLYPDAPNYPFLNEMASNLYTMGVRWIRMEFHAEEGDGYGYIDFRKYDWFINEVAPRFGFKILALFNTGILKGAGSDLQTLQQSGTGETAFAYINAFTQRAVEIAAHYGDKLHAYEILNEPNKSGPMAAETQGKEDEIDPHAVGMLMSVVFPRLKMLQPAPVLLGGLLTGGNRESRRDARGYLQAVYESPAARTFRGAQSRWPFDAIALHPYRDGGNDENSAAEVLAKLDAVYGVMQANGDAGSIWVTEFGLEAGPTATGDGPSEGEIRQANFLNQVYTGALQTRGHFVQRLFWFKYEDIWVGRDETWGVVRLAPDGANQPDPNGAIARRRPAFDVYSALTPPPPALAVLPPPPPAALQVATKMGGDVRFNWKAALPGTYKVKEHQLFRASRPDMSDAQHVATLGDNLSVAGRAPRGTYYYALRAVDSAVPPHVSSFSNVVKVSRLI